MQWTFTLQPALDDDEAIFDGIITRDGLLDGHLQTRNEEYYIEPASTYYDSSDSRDFHSVIYATSRVNFPNATHGSIRPQYGSKFFSLHNPLLSKSLFDLDVLSNIEHMFPAHRKKRSSPKDTATDDHKFYSYQWPFVIHDDNASRSSGSNFSELGMLIDKMASGKFPMSMTPREPSHQDHFRKTFSTFSVSSGNRNAHDHRRYWRDIDSLLYTESEPYGIKAVHPRTHWIDDQRHHDRHVVVDPKKTTCMLYLQADHLFFEKMKSEEACIDSMTRHVQKVNSIYKNTGIHKIYTPQGSSQGFVPLTDFDQDGRPDNISFLIKRIKVHTTDSLKDPEYRYPSTYGVEKFLELFSEEDYDAFCLAYMFTYRDFEGGTLGLAWTGDLKNAGGVCEKNGVS